MRTKLLVLLLVWPLTRAAAQGLASAPTPVEAAVRPSAVLPGAAVTIAGTSFQVGTRATVSVVVAPPGGAPVTLSAPLDAAGGWSIGFSQTRTVGRYAVTATAPDGRGSARTSFDVLAVGAATQVVDKDIDTVLAEEERVFDAIDTVLARAPPSPPAAAAQQKAANGKATRAKLQADWSRAKDEIERLNQLITDYPILMTSAELMDAMGGVAGLQPELEARAPDLVQAEKAIAKASNLCENLDDINEALSLVSLLTDLMGKPLEKLNNLLLDKDFPDRLLANVPPDQRTTNFKLAVSESFKALVAIARGGPLGFGTLAAFASDLAGFMAQQVFDTYCEKFTGPFTAQFSEELFQGPISFWSYTETLKGKISLRYQKDAGDGAIPLTGELDGNGTAFTLKENLRALEKDLRVRAGLVARKAFAPIGASFVAQAGRLVRTLVPSSFSVPITGTLKGNQLTFTIPEGGGRDFSSQVVGRAIYVFLAPAAPLPSVQVARLDYQKAWWVLSRGTEGSPTFTVTVPAGQKYSLIQRSFSREQQMARFKVTFKVDIQACNPDCP
jgi:hypothetical protein